jgi:hypothetical protein
MKKMETIGIFVICVFVFSALHGIVKAGYNAFKPLFK